MQDINQDENSAVEGYESFVQQKAEGLLQISVLVGGVNCAGCIQKIESSLNKEDDIEEARLNFSTKRLSLVWKGSEERANELIQKVEALGYGVKPYTPDIAKEESGAQAKFLLLCLGVAGFAMGNIMLLSVGVWSSSAETMGVATRDFMHWISAAIAIPTIMFSGRPFFRSALKALKTGHTNMDVPISLAITLAGGMSLYETVNHGEYVYFDSAVMLIFFLLTGRYLDFRARNHALSSATDLLSSLSGFANVIDEDGSRRRVPIRDVREGMIIHVPAGEKFPSDAQVIKGESEVDTSLVTGETLPRSVAIGDDVFAGTFNIAAPVTVKVAKAAEDSLLSDIVRLMEKATQGQASYVRMADKAAKLYTPVVHSMAAIAFIGWWFVGGIAVQEALMISVTVLIITCPCALGLAVPVVQVLASGRLMKSGVMVKSGDALERLSTIDVVLMDKTGTLTVGKPSLQGEYKALDLQIAASLAAQSAHPLSNAICAAYDGEHVQIEDVLEIPGKGLQAVWNGNIVRLGSRGWCGDDQSSSSKEYVELWLSIEGGEPVMFSLLDKLRPDSAAIIECMKGNGLKPIILSGDREAITKRIASECGIDEYYAEKTPPEKFEIMQSLKEQGYKVLMVGDGLNDAPTLAGADVSMAPGSAIDMAQNAADIVFMGEMFSPVHDTYKVSVTTQSLVKQNFALAVIYNAIAIPLALAGLVTPLIAAIAMSGSSLIVIGNSFRLKFDKLRR